MKLSIKSVLRSSYSHFECFDDNQILFRAGNTLCLKTIAKPDSDFISLDKSISKLYTYKPYTNRKGVFTAQKIGKEIYLACYSLKNERRAIQLVEQSAFLADIEQIELLSDQYDNTLLYAAARTKETACVFIADFNKLKLLAVGYLPLFEDLKVDGRENMRLSVCGHNGSHNYLKMLQYVSGQWQITEQPLKKIYNPVFQHQLLLGNRLLAITNSAIYVLQDNQIIKTIGLQQGSNIREVIKIPRGLVLRLQNDTLKLMVEDADQVSFVMSSNLTLALQPNDKIQSLRLSNNHQQIWLRTTRKNVYVWRCDNIGLELGNSDLVFNQVDISSSNEDSDGSISISTGKKYVLLTGNNSITLWSVERNECVLSSDFMDPNDPNKRTLYAGAINPDGNSLILAFQDKIKIFQILFTKFKQTNEFQIKRCQQIIYSHGGQLVACRYGRGVNSSIVVINLLRFCQVCTFKVQNEPLQILWNQLDDELIVSVQNGSIQIYKISEQARISNIKISGNITHARLDYKTRKLVVSTDQNIHIIQNGKIVDTIAHPISDFAYLFPLYGMYFIAGKSGTLYWSNHIKFQTFHQLPIFSHKPYNMICRSGYLLAYSSFQDIMVLRISRSVEKKKDASQQIVMIEKDQILNLFEKVRTIQNNFDIATAATNIKLEEERQSYEHALKQIKDHYTQELNFANSKFVDITAEKLKQEKQSERLFEVIENGQTRNVADLQKMYERKIEFERQRFMNMEQRFLQYKIESERKILQLQSRFNRQVSQIRQEYASRSKEESQLVQKQKERHLCDKKRVQFKLLELQEENEVVLTELQKSKDVIIGQLRLQLKQLQEYSQKNLSILQTQTKDLKDYERKAKISQNQLKRLSQSLQQSENRVNLLERQIERRNQMIDERDQVIVQQGQQIGGLEKAKYVLSFRTTEIRKELEPKESMIDKLKSELFKLDQEFKAEKKKNFQYNQKLEKVEAVNLISKREISDLKIALKCKERAHDELCSQIFMVINTIDPKDWNAQFVKIYQNYIKQEKHKNRRDKKKDDTIQQINRHLVHVEQSLVQVTAGTDRLLKGKDKEVVRKMKENSDLVYELNVMRKKENQFHKEKRELANQNARLKREAGESIKTTTRAHTANTGFTRRVIASRQLNSRDKTTTLDISDLNISKRDMREIKKEKSRLTSARRTLMVQDDIKSKSGKFFDLAKQLQSARNTIKRQDRMIQQLNHRLLGSAQIYESGTQ